MSGESLDIGTLSGRIELVDGLTTIADKIVGVVDNLAGHIAESGKRAGEAAAGYFTAEVAFAAAKEAGALLVETLKEITIEGSHAADIEDTFGRLTSQAGLLGDTLLDKTRDGLRGTATDMDIMTRINQNLAVGLNLSADKMDILSRGAFALAKATGGDASDALDKMSSAMVTGRVRAIQLLTGKIDLANAEDIFAAKLGTTTDHLSAQGKQAAIQEIILQKVEEATARVGDQQTRLADKVKQSEVNFANFMEELGTAVATSPVIMAGYDGIKASIGLAFGDNQAAMVHKLAGVIDDAAITIVGFGHAAVIGVNVAFTAFELLRGSVFATAAGLEGLALIQEGHVLTGAKIMAEGVGTGSKIMLDATTNSTVFQQKLGVLGTELDNVAKRMKEAKKENEGWTDVIRDSTEKTASFSTVTNAAGLTIALTKEELKKYKEAWTDLNSIGTNYADTLAGLEPKTRALILDYANWGAKVDQLTAAFPGLTKAQAEAAVASVKAAKDIQKVYDDTFNFIAKSHGDNINNWIKGEQLKLQATLAALQAEGKLTQEAMDAEMAKYNATVDAEIAKRAEGHASSRAAFQKEYDDAKNYLDLMLKDRKDFTDEEIREQQLAVNEKGRSLAHWYSTVTDSLAKEHQATVTSVSQQVMVVNSLYDAWAAVAEGVDHTRIMVRGLNGELETLEAYEKRQHNGGSFDVTSQNFNDAIEKLRTSGGFNPSGMGSNIDISAASMLAHMGYSLQEITSIFANEKNGSMGPLPPPQGPRIPGFKDGGYGDFGEGTLAMLHGKEFITPAGQMGGDTNIFYINGTAEETARKVSDVMMNRAKQTRYFGTA